VVRRCVWSRNIKNRCSIYIYVYDINSLRVNDLTLILLMWRKWWTPNNASKWQMGFNSAFKGLMAGAKTWMYHLLSCVYVKILSCGRLKPWHCYCQIRWICLSLLRTKCGRQHSSRQTKPKSTKERCLCPQAWRRKKRWFVLRCYWTRWWLWWWWWWWWKGTNCLAM